MPIFVSREGFIILHKTLEYIVNKLSPILCFYNKLVGNPFFIAMLTFIDFVFQGNMFVSTNCNRNLLVKCYYSSDLYSNMDHL